MPTTVPAWLPPIVADDSPLYRIRASTPRAHVGWLCAFRFLIETSDLAFRRMIVALDDASVIDASSPTRDLFVTALADAWTFLDSAHRIYELFDRMPTGMRADAPPPGEKAIPVTAFRDALGGKKQIKALRNLVQHPDDWAPKTAEGGDPALGSITWISNREGVMQMCLLAPGPPPSALRASQEYGHADCVVENVTFHWQDHELNLSRVHAAIAAMATTLADNLGANPDPPIVPWEAVLIRQRLVFIEDVEPRRRNPPKNDAG